MDPLLRQFGYNIGLMTLIVLSALGAFGAPDLPARKPGLYAIPNAHAADSVPQVYLPIVHVQRATATPLRFASAIDIFGVPLNPATRFSYGITKLYASTVVYNGNGQYANMLFIYPDRGGVENGKELSNDQERLTVSISGRNGAPLDRGTYIIHFSLNRTIFETGMVIIE